MIVENVGVTHFIVVCSFFAYSAAMHNVIRVLLCDVVISMPFTINVSNIIKHLLPMQLKNAVFASMSRTRKSLLET